MSWLANRLHRYGHTYSTKRQWSFPYIQMPASISMRLVCLPEVCFSFQDLRCFLLCFWFQPDILQPCPSNSWHPLRNIRVAPYFSCFHSRRLLAFFKAHWVCNLDSQSHGYHLLESLFADTLNPRSLLQAWIVHLQLSFYQRHWHWATESSRYFCQHYSLNRAWSSHSRQSCDPFALSIARHQEWLLLRHAFAFSSILSHALKLRSFLA